MSTKLPETGGAEEVDLGQLFKLIGKGFERIFNFLGNILNKLFLGFVWMVFFIKRHFLKILIAGIVGFGLASIKEKIAAPVYGSSIIIKQNYNTGENLYGLVDYYNSIIKNKDTTSLQSNLNMTYKEIDNVVGFSVVPLLNENKRIRDYNDYIKNLDSTLTSDFTYGAYIQNTELHHYMNQKIYIFTIEPIGLEKVFERIVENINSSDFFNKTQEKDITQLKNREAAIKQSLKESEDLRNTYKKVLEAQEEKLKGSQTTVTIEGGNNVKQTKEFDLFKNDLVLRRELVEIERIKQDKTQIVEIVSNELGGVLIEEKIEMFDQNFSVKPFYAVAFALVCFLGLLGIEFFVYLEKFKDKV